MSFSSKAKNEICRLPIENKCCTLAELASLIYISGSINLSGNNKISFKVQTENAAIARRFFSLLKNLYNISTEVLVRKTNQFKKNNTYLIHVSEELNATKILTDIGILRKDEEGYNTINYGILDSIIKNECCKKAYIRGAFLGSGSISDPEKNYHLEIVTHNEKYADEIIELINNFGLNMKIVERKNNFVLYLKEGEQIVTLLNIIGAHQALFKVENIRIMKEMRNNVNRVVNCETANLTKTVNAAYRQLENINYIKKNIGLNKLPQNLRDVAELRLNYQDSSLKELGEMLSPPLGKSGINHRLKKLDKIAEDLKIQKGEM